MKSEISIREFYGKEAYRFEQLTCPAYHIARPELTNREEAERQIEESDRELLKDVTLEGNQYMRVGTFLDNKLAAAMKVYAFNGYFDGELCEMNGIGDVLTDPDMRRNGAISILYRHLFEKMREKGQLFSHLYPFTMRFYRKFGYELSCTEIKWTIPVDYLPQIKFNGMVRYDNEPAQQEDIKKVYYHYAKKYNLAGHRSEEKWKKFFKGIEAYAKGRFSYIHYSDNGPDGFFSYASVPSENEPMTLDTGRVFYFTNTKALQEMLAFLGSFSAYCKQVKITLPSDVELSYVLDEICGGWGKKNVGKELLDVGATRVIDVAAVLKKAKYIGNGSFVVKVEDAYCEWNNQCFRVDFSENTVSVNIENDMVIDAIMSINCFTALILGFHSIDEAEIMPGVTVLDNISNLRKAFYRKKVWTGEHF